VNYHDAMKFCEAQLNCSESPKADARYLLQDVVGKSYSYILTWPEKELTESETACLQSYISRRQNGEPIAYIIGYQDFWGLQLRVNSATLIPRPDTEVLVENVLKHVSDTGLTCVDLGTGSGAIALALKSENPSWQLSGIDQSEDALVVAKLNSQQLGLDVEWLKSSWLDEVKEGSVDLIVSNPPYIEAEDQHLNMGDVRFEPKTALVSGLDGLNDIRLISEQAKTRLRPNGWLFFEHGYNQKQAVGDIMRQSGFISIEHCKDYAGNDRVTLGRLTSDFE
jgi:release factor glutamine methyltransferase